MEKKLDLICIGRVAVDLYAQQIGAPLEDVTSFAKYLGGSSGNLAYGSARLGVKSSMLARVGDEHMGRFLIKQLQQVGVDTSHIISDPKHLTGLVILGIKDQETFPLIFYRENCADMALEVSDIKQDYINSAKCVAITGTHLSHPNTRAAVLKAIEYAQQGNVKLALDLDYRPVLWGLTAIGDGETRFIANQQVTQQLQAVLSPFDVIVGTEEEFHIAGGSDDTLQALKEVRKHTNATLVCKRGALGCSVFTAQIPDNLDHGINVYGVKVEVLNVLGAGDAFMSGLLYGYINNHDWQTSCSYANACGALVVSRHGCAPAMPSLTELNHYLENRDTIPRPDLDNNLNHLHRTTTRPHGWSDNLGIFAFDHRKQLEDLADLTQASHSKIEHLKLLLAQAALEVAQANPKLQPGILADTTYGQQALNKITGLGWWIGRPIEQPGSRPLSLEHGDLGSQLISWPSEHIVKCLVFMHPDDPAELMQQQQQQLLDVYQACQRTNHQLLLELIVPADKLTNSSLSEKDQLYYSLVELIYNKLNIKPDWWKLPGLTSAGWEHLSNLIKQQDPQCHGIVMLGLDAPLDELKASFAQAKDCALVKGFAVGRSIFAQPSKEWLAGKIDDQQLVAQVADNYQQLVAAWLNK